MKCIDIAIGIVFREGKVLICQRRAEDTLGGLWEFPGGKREPGETLEECLLRELMEETAIRAVIAKPLAPIPHDYPHGRILLHPFLCSHLEGDAQPLECQRLQWVLPHQLRDFSFPPANAPLIREISAMRALE